MRALWIAASIVGLSCGGSGGSIRDPAAPDAGTSGGNGGGPGGGVVGGGVAVAGGAAGASAGGATAGGASAGGATAGGTTGGGSVAGGAGGGVVARRDDARVVSSTLPTSLPCGQRVVARVTMQNLGNTPWTAAEGYKLGAVDDSDPFSPGRYELPAGVSVAPGQSYEFQVALQAPSSSTSGTTDWRMVREFVNWFGETTSRPVSISCGPPTFDLSTVVIQGAPPGAPDVRSFAVTSTLTSLAFRPDTFSIDHTRRGQWPPVQIAPDGTTQEATVWVFFRIGGVWYGTGGERLRPNQTDKQLSKASDIGPGWLYDSNRWGPMTNYVPQVGEYVGFMVVAGSTRSDANSPVQERSKVVLVPFPADYVTTSFPPFAWEEP